MLAASNSPEKASRQSKLRIWRKKGKTENMKGKKPEACRLHIGMYLSSYYCVSYCCVILLWHYTAVSYCCVSYRCVNLKHAASTSVCMCPHTTVYHTAVSSYCCVVSSCCYPRVLILLYMCPHILYVSSYYYARVLILLYMCPSTHQTQSKLRLYKLDIYICIYMYIYII